MQPVTTKKELTFSSLLKQFYSKAAEVNIDLEPDFDFMLTIPNNISEIISALDASINGLFDGATFDKIVLKVADFKEDTRKYIHKSIKEVKDQHAMTMKIFNDELSPELKFEPSDRCDKILNDSFKQWIENPVKQKRIQIVNENLSPMKWKYDELQKSMNIQCKETKRECKLIKRDIILVKTLHKTILRLTDSDSERIKRIINNIVNFIMRINENQNLMLHNLEHMKIIFNSYNRLRMIWAEFLIGMRNSLTSTPKSVKRSKRMLCKHLAKNVFGSGESKKKTKS